MHDLDEKALLHIRDWAHDLMLQKRGGQDAHGFHGGPVDRHQDNPTEHPAGVEERGGPSHSDVEPMPHEVKPAEGEQDRGGGMEHGSSDDDGPHMSTLKSYSFHSMAPKRPSKAPVSRKGRY